MPAFAGFPAGKSASVPLPEQFFTAVAPEIEDVTELKVTLHLFWALYQKVGEPRCASDRELLADPLLRRMLRRQGDPRPIEERLRAALETALSRGTLLRVRVRVDDEVVAWYFFNTARSRKTVDRLLSGQESPELLLELEETSSETHDGQTITIEVERPNIFALYEQNIGLLSPLLAEELREAEERYPREWIEEAFRLAVSQNKRRWAYIRAILKRWEAEGKGDESHG